MRLEPRTSDDPTGRPDVLSERLQVPKNYMFIGTPSDRFPYRIEKLGGVRVVL